MLPSCVKPELPAQLRDLRAGKFFCSDRSSIAVTCKLGQTAGLSASDYGMQRRFTCLQFQ